MTRTLLLAGLFFAWIRPAGAIAAPAEPATAAPFELQTPAPLESASPAPLAAATPSRSLAPASRADGIFAAARKAVARGGYPRFASYQVRVTSTHDGNAVTDTWMTYEDVYDSSVYSRIFSLEEQADPSTPSGTNIVLPIFGTINREKPADLIGPVAFAANQTYGLAATRGYTVARDLSGFYEESAAPPVIGRAETQDRLYDVELLDSHDDGAGPAYHLKLTPLSEPDTNRLRELWISVATGLPSAAVVQGIGNRAPTDRIPWRVEFAQLQGGTYLSREFALGTLDYGSFGKLTNVVIDFTGITPSAHFPFHNGTGLSTWVAPLSDP